MSRWTYAHYAGLACLMCCVLYVQSRGVSSPASQRNGGRLMQMCGLGTNGICAKNVAHVPPEVLEICARCGNYWGNLAGFDYCCRCSDKIFAFCMEAVLGGEQDNGYTGPFRS